MTNLDLNKRAGTSFLLSLILHMVIVLVLGFILLEHPREKAVEFVAVDMLKTMKRITPPRRIEARESVPDFRNPNKRESNAQFKPQKLELADTNFTTRQSRSADVMTVLPEEPTTAVDRLKSRFDMPLPKPTGATIMRPGAGTRQDRPSAPPIGLTGGAGIFEKALYWIARNIVSKNKTGKEDIVFLIDASGSMEENIAAVARYTSKMIDVFEEGDLDYTLGVIRFNRVLKDNNIKIYEQTKDVDQIRKVLRSIKCDGDERTLDAVEIGLTQVRFRNPTDKTFVLVTDETFTPRTLTRQTRRGMRDKEMLQEDYQEVLRMCQNDRVKVSVLGIEDEMHKSLAKETGGLWFQIPQQDGLP